MSDCEKTIDENINTNEEQIGKSQKSQTSESEMTNSDILRGCIPDSNSVDSVGLKRPQINHRRCGSFKVASQVDDEKRTIGTTQNKT